MERFRITAIDVNNIGVFDRLNLTFSNEKPKNKAEIHILVGANSTGKTTLLQCLTYFDFAFRSAHWNLRSHELNSRSNEENILKTKGYTSIKGKVRKSPSIKLHFDNQNINFPTSSTSLLEGSSRIHSYYNTTFNDGALSSNSVFFFAYTGSRYLSYRTIDPTHEEEFNPLDDALNVNRDPHNPGLYKWIYRTWVKAAIAETQGRKKSAENYRSILRKVEKGLCEILKRRVRFSINEETLQVDINIDDTDVNFNQLADGYKSILSWLADLMYRLDKVNFWNGDNSESKTFVLFLDEIDVHLHPEAQRLVLPVIQELFPTAQIFVTTHSPFVLGSVDGAWVYKFEIKNGKSTLSSPPFKSEDGWSYRYIFEKAFGIHEDFGVRVVSDLNIFYSNLDRIQQGHKNVNKSEFLKLAQSLANQSTELRALVGSELNQLERLTKKDFSIR